jgi:hypothetical protein
MVDRSDPAYRFVEQANRKEALNTERRARQAAKQENWRTQALLGLFAVIYGPLQNFIFTKNVIVTVLFLVLGARSIWRAYQLYRQRGGELA